MLALFASLLPSCDRSATQSSVSGQAGEGSTDDRKAPASPSSGGY